MTRYLITGGAGFIGSNFVKYMLDKYDNIEIIDVDILTYAGNLENLRDIKDDLRHIFEQIDIRDEKNIFNLFRKYQPDYVINFAAESHVDRSIENPSSFIDTNIRGTLNLLNAAKTTWLQADNSFKEGCRYLQISTDEVYGSLSTENLTEYFYEDTPLNPNSPYSASKASADLLVLAYNSTYGFPAMITRCSNNYGPNQYPEKLIPLMIGNALNHHKLPIYGDGENIRDWLYVEDHCKAIDLVLHNGKIGEVYNIGGHNERSNNYIVKKITEICNELLNDDQINEKLIEYVEDRKGHDRRYGIAPDKINKELGWVPETTFEDGVIKTVKWYLDNRNWMYPTPKNHLHNKDN